MRWAGHVARMREDRSVHRVLVGKPEERGHCGHQGVDGRIILSGIFRRLEGFVGTGWCWLRIVMMAVICGYGEELSGSINAGNFLTSCKVYWLASQEGLCSME